MMCRAKFGDNQCLQCGENFNGSTVCSVDLEPLPDFEYHTGRIDESGKKEIVLSLRSETHDPSYDYMGAAKQHNLSNLK